MEKTQNDLKEKLRRLGKDWNASGEYDDTEFIGRYFLNDTDLDKFAQKHGLTLNDGTEDQDNHDPAKIMKFYDCELIYDYPGSNPNRQFGDVEIVFNEVSE